MVTIKSKKEIELMREACRVVALTYEKLEKHIKPGISTQELDQIAEKTMRDLGAIPAEKGYDPGIRGMVLTVMQQELLLLEKQPKRIKDW